MTKRYRRSPHTIYELKYHFVWVTKYRYCILEGEIKALLEETINQIRDDMGIVVLEGQIGEEHIHRLKKTYWGKRSWARGYFVSSVGIDEETIKQCIKNQRDDTPNNQMKL